MAAGVCKSAEAMLELRSKKRQGVVAAARFAYCSMLNAARVCVDVCARRAWMQNKNSRGLVVVLQKLSQTICSLPALRICSASRRSGQPNKTLIKMPVESKYSIVIDNISSVTRTNDIWVRQLGLGNLPAHDRIPHHRGNARISAPCTKLRSTARRARPYASSRGKFVVRASRWSMCRCTHNAAQCS